MGKRKNDQNFTRYAQRLLNAAGDFGLKETGVNDAATQAAFRQIQSALGFRLTGTATPETLAALQKGGKIQASVPLPRPRPRTVAASDSSFASPRPSSALPVFPETPAAEPAEVATDAEAIPSPDARAIRDTAAQAVPVARAREIPDETSIDMAPTDDRLGVAFGPSRSIGEQFVEGVAGIGTPRNKLIDALDEKIDRTLSGNMIETANSPLAARESYDFDVFDFDRQFMNRYHQNEGDAALDGLATDEFFKLPPKPQSALTPSQPLLLGDMWKAVKGVASGLNPIGTAQAAEPDTLDAAIAEAEGQTASPGSDALDELLGVTTPAPQPAPTAPTEAAGGGDIAGDFKRAGETVGAIAKDVGLGVALSGGEMVRGARNAVQAMLDFIDPVGDKLATTFGDVVLFDEDGNLAPRYRSGEEIDPEKLGIKLPEIQGSGTVTGGAIAGIAQFLVGFEVPEKANGHTTLTAAELEAVSRFLAEPEGYWIESLGTCMGDWIPTGRKLLVDPTADIKALDLVAIVIKPGPGHWGSTLARELEDDGRGIGGMVKIYLGRHPIDGADAILVGQLSPPTIGMVPLDEIEALHAVAGTDGDWPEMPALERQALTLLKPLAYVAKPQRPINPGWRP